MSVEINGELDQVRQVSAIVAQTLRKMRSCAKVGMSTQALDEYGGELLQKWGARSAPKLSYDFPGHTCISVNRVIAHGVPDAHCILQEGDLVNIDVSAEREGFWADNSGSFVLGEDLQGLSPLVEASRHVLQTAIEQLHVGMRVSEFGRLIEKLAKEQGFRVIRNLAGHGIGRSLHEAPRAIYNRRNRSNFERFKENSVVAIETFLASHSDYAVELPDGWTLVGNRGGFVAQHEHTVWVTEEGPLILTQQNGFPL